mgnify:FL=1
MKQNNFKKGCFKKVGDRKTRTEDVILTYVRPINKHSATDILQCYICTNNGFIKIGADVWRDLDYHDVPSHPIKTFPSLAELEKQYEVLYYLKCEQDVKTTKIIYGKWRYAYGLSG